MTKDNIPDKPKTIRMLLEDDIWVRKFVDAMCDLYGMPCSSRGLQSQTERFMYAFALISVTTSMRRMENTWRGLHGKVKPADAAWEFARRYHEKYKTMVIPQPSEYEKPEKVPITSNKKRIHRIHSGSQT